MLKLPYDLQRTVLIRAVPETVFRFFTDSARFAAWWGAGSTIDATPGGKVYIRHPNGVETVGEVLEIQSPERIVFTYGYASGNPIPPGSSRVTIRLEPVESGTRLFLRHEFAEPGPRDLHVQGWRFQLSLFANAVANEVYAGAETTVDQWYEAWTIADDTARAEFLARVAAPEVSFRDRYSLLAGLEDLTAHSGAAQRFMPGIQVRRNGSVRQCQGTVLAEWIATDKEGKKRMSGTSVFQLRPDGRIEAVTSFAK
ncbi:MAG: SRPBCC domain-containing protein [Candidatus Sulfopaludibacter sp.]|nr:SRPBCC domain-containing protein [Candidatus Sulfopaludibacter sp.]